jgi:uncharacterized protein with HEPN domain
MHIDDKIVWNVIQEHLPLLLMDVEAVLSERDTDLSRPEGRTEGSP